ncbi:septal ring lytic transglycosylase RlpA family protein [Bacteroidales bacterium OttesenSCG-928-C19]|nr:septal ring lytic transglycosylase RlpA family protein [Bacteroidales bacterium OttesenSCG-928-C19]
MIATYYSDWFEGRTTSSGHVFSQDEYTAAHLRLPLGTLLRIENPQNKRWAIVKVNDRCPKKGVLDLTEATARRLDFIKDGVIKIETHLLPDSLYVLWEFQNLLFTFCPDCSFEQDNWRAYIRFITGTNDLSRKPYSKKLKKAKQVIYHPKPDTTIYPKREQIDSLINTLQDTLIDE